MRQGAGNHRSSLTQNTVGDSSATGSFVRGELLKLLQDFMAVYWREDKRGMFILQRVGGASRWSVVRVCCVRIRALLCKM